jgi:hypothetical protein
MPNAHLRDLASLGVIADVDAYDIPTAAWSMGVNVRFKNKRVTRAPVFRDVETSLATANPRFLAVNAPSSGFDSLYIAYKSGRVYQYDNSTESNVSIAAYVDSDSEEVYTACFENDVFYVNRNDRVPWSFVPGGAAFTTLANWDANWRAKLLRAYAGALVALNITKSGTAYPTMVKTSEFSTSGAVPTTWDHTVLTNNATENTLAEMKGPITDANTLRDVMMIYGRDEAWVMQLDPGSEDVYAYRKLFEGAGAINANCSVEVDSKHYVFGQNDLWMHDGVSKASICDQRVRDFIFQNIDISQAERCYVFHDRVKKEIHFCYVSGDRVVGFDAANGTGCNRQAVYDYVNDTWSFDDLPFVFFTAAANLDQSLTYTTVTSTYNTIGGTYLDQEDSLKKTTVMVAGASTTYSLTASLYAFDPQGPGSTVAFSVNTNATLGWLLEREGIDLDEVAADLPGYKMVASLYPQGRFEPGASAIEFSVGAADYANQSINWSAYQTYDGSTLYKLDFNVAGRYLAVRIRHDDYHYVTLSGFDMDVAIISDE